MLLQNSCRSAWPPTVIICSLAAQTGRLWIRIVWLAGGSMTISFLRLPVLSPFCFKWCWLVPTSTYTCVWLVWIKWNISEVERKVSRDTGIFSASYRYYCLWFTREISWCCNQQWAPHCVLLPVLPNKDFLAYFSFYYYHLYSSGCGLGCLNLQRSLIAFAVWPASPKGWDLAAALEFSRKCCCPLFLKCYFTEAVMPSATAACSVYETASFPQGIYVAVIHRPASHAIANTMHQFSVLVSLLFRHMLKAWEMCLEFPLIWGTSLF